MKSKINAISESALMIQSVPKKGKCYSDATYRTKISDYIKKIAQRILEQIPGEAKA